MYNDKCNSIVLDQNNPKFKTKFKAIYFRYSVNLHNKMIVLFGRVGQGRLYIGFPYVSTLRLKQTHVQVAGMSPTFHFNPILMGFNMVVVIL